MGGSSRVREFFVCALFDYTWADYTMIFNARVRICLHTCLPIFMYACGHLRLHVIGVLNVVEEISSRANQTREIDLLVCAHMSRAEPVST